MKDWTTKTSWIKDYLNICEDAVRNDDTFSIFKAHLYYFRIVNNMTNSVANEYYRYIKREYPHLFNHFDKFKENDNIGSPKKYHYKHGYISGANLMYIKILGDIEKYIGIDFKSIAEIGGGFGGQAKIMHDYYPSLEKYYLYDIDTALDLQKKYLSKFDINPILNSPKWRDIGEIDLVIANFSWSELSVDLKMQYINKVIRKAKYGYITTNCPDSVGTDMLMPILEDKEIKILDYIPGKGNRQGKIIIWK